MVPRLHTAALLAIVVGAHTGCQSPATRREQLDSTYAPTRARAVVQSAEAGDSTAIHKLVDLLEDDDRAVRLYAIVALRRLCGVDFGFRHYASEVERQAAVDRWREAIRAGEVRLVSGAGGARGGDGPSVALAADASPPMGSPESERGTERK